MKLAGLPLPSYNFFVFIGAAKMPFSKISSIEIGVETEPLAEGGESRYVHSLSKPCSAEKTLVMERGSAAGELSTAMDLGGGALLRAGSFYKIIIIAVLDQAGAIKKVYLITDAILKKRSFSPLDAMSGELFSESLEFAYKDMTEIPAASLLFKAIPKIPF